MIIFINNNISTVVNESCFCLWLCFCRSRGKVCSFIQIMKKVPRSSVDDRPPCLRFPFHKVACVYAAMPRIVVDDRNLETEAMSIREQPWQRRRRTVTREKRGRVDMTEISSIPVDSRC